MRDNASTPNIQTVGRTATIILDSVVPAGPLAFSGTTPDTQGTAYTGLVMTVGEDITGGAITSVTSSTGGAIANSAISGGNVQFDWTTPNAGGSTITVSGTDKAGNAFSLTKNVTLPNTPVTAPSSAPGSFALTNDSGPNGSDGFTKNQPAASWAAVAGATSYEVSTNGTSWTDVGNVTSYAFSGLADNTYTLYARGVNSAGNGPAATIANINLNTVIPPGPLAYSGTTPDTQGTAYTGLVMTVGKDLTGGSITSVTSSTGGTIANATIDGSGNVQFDWTTPNAGGSTITVVGTDKWGNAFTLTKATTLPNTPIPATPTGLSWSGSVLSWTAVSGATSYTVVNTTASFTICSGGSATSCDAT